MEDLRDVVVEGAEPAPVEPAPVEPAPAEPDELEAADPAASDEMEDDAEPEAFEAGPATTARSQDEAALAAGATTNMDVDQSEADVIAGTILGDVHIHGRSVKPLIRPLTETVLARYRKLFVEPAGFAEAVRHQAAARGGILLVQGEDSAGKLCFACNVALRLAELAGSLPAVWHYDRRTEEPESLFAVLEKQKIHGPACVILEDVFDKQVTLGELESPALDAHVARLAAAGRWLILTTESQEGVLAGIPAPRFLAAPEAMQPIFARHLDWYVPAGKIPQAVAEFARGNWDALQEALRHPVLIESFCESLAQVVPRSVGELVDLAQRVTATGREARRIWFGELAPGEQLFAMLVFLFGGWERRSIEQAFLASVEHLRAGGADWLDDPAQGGLADLLTAVHAHASAGRVEFDHPLYADTVREQLANRRHLLWPLIEVLTGGVVIPCAGRDNGATRRALGAAAGRLALHDPERFGRLLDALAADPERREIALQATEEAIACDYEAAAGPLLAIVAGWLREGGNDRLWVAALALGRLYQAIGRLAGRQDLRLGWSRRLAGIESALRAAAARGAKGAVASSVVRMNNVDPRGCVAMLRSWLQAGEKPVRQAARAAVAAIFKALAARRRPPEAERFSCVLDLVEPLLATAAAESPQVVTVFAVLRGWLARADWRERVAATLLAAANYTTDGGRRCLRAALAAGWRGAEGDAARAIARKVAARSYSMDGLLLDQPNAGAGVLVIDPGALPQTACTHLADLLGGQMDLAITYLGTSPSLPPAPAASGDDDAQLPAVPLYAVPRLLMPALMPWQGEDLALVAVISRGPLWDLEDAAVRRPPIHRLVVIAAGEPPPPVPAVDCFPLDAAAAGPGMQALEEWLRGHWAGDLAAAEPAAWTPTLESLGVDPTRFAADVEPLLELWTETLDEPLAGAAHLDVARRILCVVAWYAAWDLEGCTDLLRDWLDPAGMAAPAAPRGAAFGAAGQTAGSPRRRGAMAAAAARMLFAMHSERGVPAASPVPAVLFETLAEPLATRDRDSADAVLAAVRRWLEDPAMAAYLASDVRDGRGRLLRWAERFSREQLAALRAALPPPAEAVGEEDEAQAVLDRLRVRILQGPPLALPPLCDAQSYVLIVFDAGEPRLALRRRWAEQAAEIFAAVGRNPDLVPAIYRLGEVRPAWVARRVTIAGSDLIPGTPPPPRLLAPLLATADLRPERVRLLLVLGASPILDAEDLVDSVWRDTLAFHGGERPAQGQPWFAELPQAVGESASAIVQHLQLVHGSNRQHPGGMDAPDDGCD